MTPPRVVARGWVLAGGFRGVGDAAPYGLPVSGRRREVAPHPALRGHLPPRGEGMGCRGGIHPSRDVCANASLRGASGTPPPTVCPRAGGGGRSPLIRPCGATFPQGGKAWVVGEGFIPPGMFAPTRAFAGRRGRRPLRFARERAAAGGRPSSGPAGPPSPKGEGRGCRGGIHPSRGVCGGGRSRRGEGTPPYGWGYGNARGVYAGTRFRAAAR